MTIKRYIPCSRRLSRLFGISALLLILLVSGCGRKGETSDSSGSESADSTADSSADDTSDSSADVTSDTLSAVETMEFTDVIGGVHTLLIDEAAAMHDYDTQSFVLDGQDMTYTDSTNYTYRLGIDVSYYQGDIDWESVYDAGYEYAFIRIGFRGYGEEGTLVEDEAFQTNLEQARSAGLDVGVYFYAQALSEEEASEEAAFVLELLNGVSLELPVVYDPEYVLDSEGNRLEDARTSGLDGEQVTLNTLAFCDIIEEAGYQTAFYSNMLSESEVFDMGLLSDYSVWYADYNETPQTPYAFTFWQYSETGSVSGVEGNVDLNIQLIPAG